MDKFYDEGYRIGTASASASQKEIRQIWTSDKIAILCGEKLASIQANTSEWHIKNIKSWSVGFFDGFCNRADDVK